MNDLTKWQNYLRVTAICLAIIDAIFIIIGGVVAFGSVDPEFAYGLFDVTPEMFGGLDAQASMSLLGGILIVGYAFNLVVALFSYLGAKDPSKIMPGIVLSGIFSAACLVNLTNAAMSGNPMGTAFGQALLALYDFYACCRVRKLSK